MTRPPDHHVRGRAELVGETRVRFICPLGHSQVEDLGRKSLPASKRLSATAVATLAKWWSGPQGVTFTCKTCAATRQNER